MHLAWESPPVGAQGLWHWLPEVSLKELGAGQETEGSKESPVTARVKAGEPRNGELGTETGTLRGTKGCDLKHIIELW